MIFDVISKGIIACLKLAQLLTLVLKQMNTLLL